MLLIWALGRGLIVCCVFYSTDEDDYWVDHMEHPDAHARPFDQLEREFVRDAPRTRVYIDGVQVTNFKRGFWRILKCFGWSHGARVLYMSTGDALAKSYTRGKKAVEAQFCCGALDKQSNSEYLFVQGRTHQDNRIDTKTGQVVLEKTFLLVRLEPYSVQEQWRLVKTFKVKTNTSVDEWTREWRRDKPIDGILSSVRTFPGEDSRLHDAENDKSFVARRFCGPRFDLLQDPAPTDVPIHTRPTSTTTVKAVADHENVTKNMFTNRTLTQSSSQSPSAAVCSGNSNTNRGSAYTVLFDGDNVRLDGDVVLTAVTWSSKGPSLYDDHQHDTDAIDHVSDPGMPHFDCDEERAGNDEHLNYHTSDPILVLSESASCV